MRYSALAAAVILSILAACGAEPADTGPAAPAQALPDGAMYYLVLEDPAAVLEAVDGYLAQGAPALGQGVASEWTLNALNCASFDELSTRFGLDPRGTLVLFQKGMGNSFGLAVQVTDAQAVWANLEQMGMQVSEGEEIEGLPVREVIVAGALPLKMAVKRDVLIAAVSRPLLSEMAGLLDSARAELPVPELDSGTLYMSINFAAIAPILSAQMPMIRQQALAGMQAGEEPQPQAIIDIMGLYFDAFGVVVNQTRDVRWMLTMGTETATSRMWMTFKEGSDLERLLGPLEIEDLSSEIPAGELMMARASLNPDLGREVTGAFAQALGFTPDSAMMRMAEAFSRNTAVSIMSPLEGSIFHMVAVYEIGEDLTLDEVATGMSSMVEMASSITDSMPMVITEPEMVEIDGRTYMSYGQSFQAPEGEGGGLDFSMSFWLTKQDGMLYLESAPEPTVIPQLLDGTWQGESAAESGRLDYPDDYEMAFAMDVGAYMSAMMQLSAGQSDIPPEVMQAMGQHQLWIRSGIDMNEDGMLCESTVNGADLVSFIMGIVTMASQ